ncbi:MAG: DUF421 domain-containing protein [Pseudorhodoplanes sp.]
MKNLSELADDALGLSLQAQDLNAGQVSLRAVVVFAILLLIIRLGKKRFLGQATAFDAVLIIVIGSIASRAISGTAPFFATLAGTATLAAVHWCVSLITRDHPKLGGLVKGHSTLVIENGEVQRGALRDAHMSDDDLLEDLRQKGIDDPRKAKTAYLERNGRLSVIKMG